MCCSYCYETDKTSIYSWNDIKPTLNQIINNHTKKTSVEFIGGEPLLNFKLLRKSVEYLNKNKVEIGRYKISTNGTILNKEIINFLKLHNNIEVYISIDGNRFMNQLRTMKNNKKNSYDKIIKNYLYLKSEIDSDRIIAHMVAHLYNVGYLYDGIKHLYDLGFKKIDIGIIQKTMKIDKDFCDVFIEQFKKISLDIKNNKLKDLQIMQLIFKPFISNKIYKYNESNKLLYELVDDNINNLQSDNTIYYLKNQIYNNHLKVMKGC